MDDIKQRGGKLSISIKLALVGGILTLVLLSINSLVVRGLENRLVSRIFDEYINVIDKSFDQQLDKQTEGLKENVPIHMDVLSNAIAPPLSEMDMDSIKQILSSYIKLPELKAVEVLDDSGAAYFSIWKAPEIRTNKQMPDKLNFDKQFKASAEAFFKGRKVGYVNIYFTDDMLKNQIMESKNDVNTDMEMVNGVINKQHNKINWIQRFTFLLIVGVLITTIIFTMNTIAINPLKKLTAMVKDLVEGEGDLTMRLNVDRKDEINELAQWFNRFIDKLQVMIRNIAGNANTLNQSSSELSNLSGQMSDGADQMSAKANSVATASEEMSSNMDSVAAAMEQAATNVGMVAGSAEEMTATINEIAQNSEKARTITGESVDKAQGVSVKVDELGRAAQEIGKVTETISEISEQTNLLALNATIEAARAGEAGKGFAVVANEIKELARQTAEATEEIKGQIEGIQNSATGTVSEIDEILKVINNINEIVSTIATAVEEQSVTTREIAENVSQASQGIQEVNENVSQSNTVSRDIAREITEVNQSASDMTNSSAQVNLSAQELKNLAEELNEMVNKFKV